MENGKNLIHSFNQTESSDGNFRGLTKREYFAAMAMQGYCVSTPIKEISLLSKIKILFGIKGWMCYNHVNETHIAKSSIAIADELLKQLER